MTSFRTDWLGYLRLHADALGLSLSGLRRGTLTSLGAKKVAGKLLQPINSPLRYPEYVVMGGMLDASLRRLAAREILDIGSPKLFGLLAAQRSDAEFYLTDIWRPAIDEAEVLRTALAEPAQARVHLGVADVRDLPTLPPGFPTRWRLAFSMSVLEHVEPAVGGDVESFARLGRVLERGGELIVSLPIGPVAHEVFKDDSHYGRLPSAGERVFFQRVYDRPRLASLLETVSGAFALAEVCVLAWPESAPVREFVSSARWTNPRALVGPAYAALAMLQGIRSSDALPPGPFPVGDIVLRLVRQ